MKITSFDWDENNVEHVGKHQVDCDEVEEVFVGVHRIFRAKQGRYAALGSALNGRYLFVVFEYRSKGEIRVVTARDMTSRERKLLRSYL